MNNDSAVNNYDMDDNENNNLNSIYLPTIKTNFNNKIEEDQKIIKFSNNMNDQAKTSSNTKPKLLWKIQLLKKDIQDRTMNAKRNLSVISRNLRNLKVLKSPHTRHIDKKRESLPLEIGKLNQFSKVNQNQQISLRISDNGLKYVNPNTISDINKSENKSRIRENSLDDYAESNYSNIKSFKFVNKSTEDLKAKLRYSTESLMQSHNRLTTIILLYWMFTLEIQSLDCIW